MSYDLMVFEPSSAPRDRAEFMKWYFAQAEWSEEHSYDDPSVSSSALQKWFNEVIEHFPALNSPLASDNDDDPNLTDHCIGRDVIYSAFPWPCAEEAYRLTRELAGKHQVGFYNVSAEEGEILFPGEDYSVPADDKKSWWKLW